MRQSIGGVALLNIIIVFIVITFGFLLATLSYVKAFKVNSKIAYSLEKFEGYNSLSDEEIAKNLETIGYRIADSKFKCPTRRHFENGRFVSYSAEETRGYKNHRYCIYKYNGKNGYFTYGIVTYIFVDVPIVNGFFKIPVFTETDSIFEFSA